MRPMYSIQMAHRTPQGHDRRALDSKDPSDKNMNGKSLQVTHVRTPNKSSHGREPRTDAGLQVVDSEATTFVLTNGSNSRRGSARQPLNTARTVDARATGNPRAFHSTIVADWEIDPSDLKTGTVGS